MHTYTNILEEGPVSVAIIFKACYEYILDSFFFNVYDSMIVSPLTTGDHDS